MSRPRLLLLLVASLLVCCFCSVAEAIDISALNRNLRKQVDVLKEHRRKIGRLERTANAKDLKFYKEAEAVYVKSLKNTYKYQRHPKKFAPSLEKLKHEMVTYKMRAEALFASLNIEGATVGRTRYGPLDDFEKVHKEFKKIVTAKK